MRKLCDFCHEEKSASGVRKIKIATEKVSTKNVYYEFDIFKTICRCCEKRNKFKGQTYE